MGKRVRVKKYVRRTGFLGLRRVVVKPHIRRIKKKKRRKRKNDYRN